MSGLLLLLAAVWISRKALDHSLPRISATLIFSVSTVLPLLLLLPFLPAFPVADDFYFLNPLRQNLQWWGDWGHAVMPGMGGFRPVSAISYDLDRLFHNETWEFRLSNYALHSAAAVALSILVANRTRSLAAAIAFAALFVVHPVHHEDVLWISGRPYVLGTVFAAFAFLSIDKTCLVFRLAAGLCALLAMSSHESFVVLPLLSVVLAPSRWRFHLTLACAAVVFLSLRYAVVPVGLEPDWSRVPRNFGAAVLRLMALPRDVNLQPHFRSPTFIITLLILSFVGLRTLRSPVSRKVVLAGWGAWLITMLPFLAFPGYADRFMYLPSAVALGAVLVASRFAGKDVTAGKGPGPACLTHTPSFSAADSHMAESSDEFSSKEYCVECSTVTALCLRPRTGEFAEIFNYLRLLATKRYELSGLVSCGMVSLLVISWGIDFFDHGKDWERAGKLANVVVETAVSEISADPQAAFRFDDVPVMFGRAYVFMTHFETELKYRCSSRGLVYRRAGEAAERYKIYRWISKEETFRRVID